MPTDLLDLFGPPGRCSGCWPHDGEVDGGAVADSILAFDSRLATDRGGMTELNFGSLPIGASRRGRLFSGACERLLAGPESLSTTDCAHRSRNDLGARLSEYTQWDSAGGASGGEHGSSTSNCAWMMTR